jgi:hypothetical protein
MHFPRRRRPAENDTDGAPTIVPPGELLYGSNENKLYFGNDDGSVTAITSGDEGGGANNYVESDVTGITGAVAITNIVSMTQAAYDALATKDASTLYIING